MDQVTPKIPRSWFKPKAFQTALDPSTMLFLHGGWPACSASHPFTESHSSTTLAVTLFPLLAVILIIFPHRDPWLYHPVDKATTLSELSWYFSSHSDGPPPSPPLLKSLSVRRACVEDVSGGEHLYWGYELPPHVRVPEDLQFWLGDGEEPPPPPPPEHMWVPMSGSSLHLPLMQISWPLQSLRVLHGPLQEDMARAGRGREMILKIRKRGTNRSTIFAIWEKYFGLRSCGGRRREFPCIARH